MTFTQTTFSDSMAISGSVLYITNAATVVLDRVKLSNGRARSMGGAFFIGGGGTSSFTIKDCPMSV